MAGKQKVPTLIYYRFQNEQPKVGEEVHCFTSLAKFRDFVRMMRGQDPEFKRMKFWEITGEFIEHDDGDAVVRVVSVRPISV